MNLGIVKAAITATVKHRAYYGKKLLVVAICGPDWKETGRETLAVDTVQAGIGDRVLTLKEGNSAQAILGEKDLPLQELVGGIVDSVNWSGWSKGRP